MLFAVGWVLVLTAVNNDLTALNGGLDIWMRLLQLVLIVAIVGTARRDLECLCGCDRRREASGRNDLGGRWSRLPRCSWPGCASTPGC